MTVHALETPRPMGRRERQRLETRNRIYEAALAEFRAVGFARAQIEAIAERAGVARGTFYFHFPTKEHVLLELQRRHERDVVERFEQALTGTPSVREVLLGVVDAAGAQAEAVGTPELAREIMAMYVRERRNVETSTLPLVVALVDHFSEAADRGELREDHSPEELALFFLTSLLGFFIGSVDDIEAHRPAFESFIDIFVKGVSP